MKLLENLTVLIVIPDIQRKTKLREVLRSVLYKADIQYEKALKGLDKKLEDPISSKFHLLFISGQFPAAELSAFVKSTQSIPENKRPAIVVSIPAVSSQDSGKIASLYLDGVSGFISDPYTSQDVTELLTKILEQKAKTGGIEDAEKSRKASSFLLGDAMSLVDEIARLASEGKEGGYALRDLKGLSKNFADHYSRDPAGYANAITEVFQKATPPAWAKTTNKKKVKSKVVKHPGVVVWEIMAERGLSEERIASLLKLESADAAALTRGHLSINETLAQNLSRVLGMSAREWLKMQTDYDAYKETQAKDN